MISMTLSKMHAQMISYSSGAYKRVGSLYHPTLNDSISRRVNAFSALRIKTRLIAKGAWDYGHRASSRASCFPPRSAAVSSLIALTMVLGRMVGSEATSTRNFEPCSHVEYQGPV
jgi:hypothetical protein